MFEGETLLSILKDERFPSRSTFYRWLIDEKNQTLRDNYALAREGQLEYHEELCLEIADDARNDWMDKAISDGEMIRVLDHEHVQRSRLRVDTRKWIAARIKGGMASGKKDGEGGEKPPTPETIILRIMPKPDK